MLFECGLIAKMAANEVTPGPIMENVVANVLRLRAEQRLSQAQLSERLRDVGHPILATGLHRLETGKRRVDVDDLIGLALAFDVAPITMLMPWSAGGTVQLTDKVAAEALAAWDWIRGLRPLTLPDDDEEASFEATRFRMKAVPMGARIGELRPGTPEYEQRVRQQTEDLRKAGKLDGEHQETP